MYYEFYVSLISCYFNASCNHNIAINVGVSKLIIKGLTLFDYLIERDIMKLFHFLKSTLALKVIRQSHNQK